MKGLGIMSGSSLDGIDIALVEFREQGDEKWKLLAFKTYPFKETTVRMLDKLPEHNTFQIKSTEAVFTNEIAEAVRIFREEFDGDADYISVHGHTVLHDPVNRYSWQLLNGGMLSSICNTTVITDFRNQDMALGGQGAPMAVLADRDLFEGYDYYLNLGGIANISYKLKESWQAYDLCPFNQVLNHFARKCGKEFDRGGHLARSGQPDDRIVGFLMDHAYINKAFPKSLDNRQVQLEWIEDLVGFEADPPDVLRSFLEFFSHLIDKVVSPQKRIFLSGGGARNEFFTAMLKDKLAQKETEVMIPDSDIIDGKEATLMAYMGYKRLKGKKNFISSTTGASADSIAGAVYLPPG